MLTFVKRNDPGSQLSNPSTTRRANWEYPAAKVNPGTRGTIQLPLSPINIVDPAVPPSPMVAPLNTFTNCATPFTVHLSHYNPIGKYNVSTQTQKKKPRMGFTSTLGQSTCAHILKLPTANGDVRVSPDGKRIATNRKRLKNDTYAFHRWRRFAD